MNAYAPQSQYTADTAPLAPSGDHAPTNGFKGRTTPSKWKTRWHGHEDDRGILAQSGRVRGELWKFQWVIAVRRSRKDDWQAISFHRDPSSLLRVLREKQGNKGAEDLAPDYELVQRRLQNRDRKNTPLHTRKDENEVTMTPCPSKATVQNNLATEGKRRFQIPTWR